MHAEKIEKNSFGAASGVWKYWLPGLAAS